MKKILAIVLICLFGSCSWIKWTGSYHDRDFCLCATVDSTKMYKLTSKQITQSIENSKALSNVPPQFIDSLITSLNHLKVKPNK